LREGEVLQKRDHLKPGENACNQVAEGEEKTRRVGLKPIGEFCPEKMTTLGGKDHMVERKILLNQTESGE